jgi:hypothetical protein
MSIDRSFPDVESPLQLAIAKHKFRPSHLYKLDATVKQRPKPKAFKISDDSEFLQCKRDASPKDYPSFRALHDPLIIYFEILQYFIIASGNIPVSQQVVLGCSEYLRILYQIYLRFERPAVLQYHFMSHNCHLAEMRDGDYAGWHVMDAELVSLNLYGNPKPASNKFSSQSGSSNGKQICLAFQSGKCMSPCANGHLHKCNNCGSSDHSQSLCTNRAKTSA